MAVLSLGVAVDKTITKWTDPVRVANSDMAKTARYLTQANIDMLDYNKDRRLIFQGKTADTSLLETSYSCPTEKGAEMIVSLETDVRTPDGVHNNYESGVFKARDVTLAEFRNKQHSPGAKRSHQNYGLIIAKSPENSSPHNWRMEVHYDEGDYYYPAEINGSGSGYSGWDVLSAQMVGPVLEQARDYYVSDFTRYSCTLPPAALPQ